MTSHEICETSLTKSNIILGCSILICFKVENSEQRLIKLAQEVYFNASAYSPAFLFAIKATKFNYPEPTEENKSHNEIES